MLLLLKKMNDIHEKILIYFSQPKARDIPFQFFTLFFILCAGIFNTTVNININQVFPIRLHRKF